MAVYAGMKFTTTAEFLKFDYTKWTVANRKAVYKAMKDAAKQWLAQIVQRVPKDSGFLLSSFENLATALNVGMKAKSKNKAGKLTNRPSVYSQETKLADLKNRFTRLRDKSIQAGYLRREGKGKSKKLVRTLAKPTKRKTIQYNVRIHQELKKDRDKVKSSTFSKRAGKEATMHTQEGLRIQKNKDDAEKVSKESYKAKKNEEYYKREFDKRQAAKAIRQLKTIQKQIDAQRRVVERAVERAPAFKLTKRPTYYKWERVEKEVVIPVKKIVDKPNPAYPTSALALIKAKKAGTLPPKTIQVEETVNEIHKRTVRRRIKIGSAKDVVRIYQHHYYPTKGVKGPLKTPFSGQIYGTPADQIFHLESESGRDAIGQELTTINKGGFETPGKQAIAFPKDFNPNTSQDLAAMRATQQARLIFSFDYSTSINYYRIMDLFNGITRNKQRINPRGAPWRSLTNANKAYLTHLRNAIKPALIPSASYIVKTKGTVISTGFSGSA